MNRLKISFMTLFIPLLFIGSGEPLQHSKASPIAAENQLINVSWGSYVVVAFEVFGTRYYHFRDFDTSNLNSPDAQAYLKNVIRYDRRVLRDRNVSNADIVILQTWGFASSSEAANLACNLERQGLQAWSTSACYSMPAQPSNPYAPAQPTQPPSQPSEPYQPSEPPRYPSEPATLAGRIIKSSQSPNINETVRYQVEASDTSDPNAPLSYNWFIDGQPVVQADGYSVYDAPTLDWAFNTRGSHSIAVTVTNRYSGLSAQLNDSVRVAESSLPMDGERTTPPGLIDQEPDLTPVVITVAGVVVALIAVSIIIALLKALFFRVAK
ncbi:MAG: hypothetical protein AB1757_30000 [Acidobacteriota bacterium]